MQTSTASGDMPPISQIESATDMEDLIADILASLREDILVVIRAELKNSLSEDFSFLENELKEISKLHNIVYYIYIILYYFFLFICDAFLFLGS